MGLFKRGSVWWMSFTYNGQQIQRSTETKDGKLAQRIFDKIKGQIAERKWFKSLPGEGITFKELMDKYLTDYSATNKAPRSFIRDKSLKDHLCKTFGNCYLVDITAPMIAEYKIKRRAEGAAPRTINYELTLMGHAFNLAIKEWEWINENPAQKVRKEKVRNTLERWLKPDEEKRLLKTAPEWLRDIVVFDIHTGLRMSELLELKWSRVDMERKTIMITEQKNRGVDTLPLNMTAFTVLCKRHALKNPDCDLVFPSQAGSRILNRNLFRAFKDALARAEIEDFRFHDLRHTFATRLVQSGVGIYEVQRLGRWKTGAMVMRYAHHNPESLRPSIEVIDGFDPSKITILSQSAQKKGYKPLLRLVTP